MSTEDDPSVAVVVRVPEDYFSDDDDICIEACMHVCGLLEEQLMASGFEIPDWIRGGCAEDWGVYYECRDSAVRYVFSIGFFPCANAEPQDRIFVQYHLKEPRVLGLLSRNKTVPLDDKMQQALIEFSRSFPDSEFFSEPQFEAVY